MKITIKKFLIINSILLFLVFLFIMAIHVYLYRFNKTERVLKVAEKNSDSFIQFDVKISGKWEKLMPEKSIVKPEYFENDSFLVNDGSGNVKTYGKTYEFTLKNLSSASITSWNAKIKIPEDAFINKSWNGKVGFVQNKGKNRQSFNTLKINRENIGIDFFEIDNLFMFPVEKNSWIDYSPSEEFFETPVSASSPDEGGFYSKTFGIIFYSYVPELKFNDIEIRYYVHRKVSSMGFFWVMLVLFVLFMIVEIILFVHIVVTKRYERRRMIDKRIIVQAIGTFSQFIDAKDTYTRYHSLRVAHYSRMIAKKMNFSEEFVDNIFYIGLLHDTGKVKISGEILNKSGKLTDEEFEEIKTHTTKATEILKGFTAIENLVEGALCHHERYDGNGYPLGLKGDQIPVVARIISVADSYDAMSSNRCYRAHLNEEKIFLELEKNKGRQFDSKVVDAFIKCYKGKEFTEVTQEILKEIRKLG